MDAFILIYKGLQECDFHNHFAVAICRDNFRLFPTFAPDKIPRYARKYANTTDA